MPKKPQPPTTSTATTKTPPAKKQQTPAAGSKGKRAKSPKKVPEQTPDVGQDMVMDTPDVNQTTDAPLEHPKISADQIIKAVAALHKHKEVMAAGKKNQLIETDSLIQLTIGLNKIPKQKHLTPYHILLPHSLNKEAEICVFVKDPAKKAKEFFRSSDIPNVKKIMGVEKLRTEWNRFESRRKLLHSYDLFLCDEKLKLTLKSLLGSKFFEAKKFPVPIKIGMKNLTRQVELARDATYLYISTGANLSVPIGRLSFEPQQVAENLIKTIDKIVGCIPKKWRNVRLLSLKTSDSPALPIFNAAPASLTKKPVEKPEAEAAAAAEEEKDSMEESEDSMETEPTTPAPAKASTPAKAQAKTKTTPAKSPKAAAAAAATPSPKAKEPKASPAKAATPNKEAPAKPSTPAKDTKSATPNKKDTPAKDTKATTPSKETKAATPNKETKAGPAKATTPAKTTPNKEAKTGTPSKEATTPAKETKAATPSKEATTPKKVASPKASTPSSKAPKPPKATPSPKTRVSVK